MGILTSYQNIGRVNFDGREFTVGEALANEGHAAKHPVILIPGIVSTALENWSTFGEYKKHFRKRYWGGARCALSRGISSRANAYQHGSSRYSRSREMDGCIDA